MTTLFFSATREWGWGRLVFRETVDSHAAAQTAEAKQEIGADVLASARLDRLGKGPKERDAAFPRVMDEMKAFNTELRGARTADDFRRIGGQIEQRGDKDPNLMLLRSAKYGQLENALSRYVAAAPNDQRSQRQAEAGAIQLGVLERYRFNPGASIDTTVTDNAVATMGGDARAIRKAMKAGGMRGDLGPNRMVEEAGVTLPSKFKMQVGAGAVEVDTDTAAGFAFKDIVQVGTTFYARMENGCEGNLVSWEGVGVPTAPRPIQRVVEGGDVCREDQWPQYVYVLNGAPTRDMVTGRVQGSMVKLNLDDVMTRQKLYNADGSERKDANGKQLYSKRFRLDSGYGFLNDKGNLEGRRKVNGMVRGAVQSTAGMDIGETDDVMRDFLRQQGAPIDLDAVRQFGEKAVQQGGISLNAVTNMDWAGMAYPYALPDDLICKHLVLVRSNDLNGTDGSGSGSGSSTTGGGTGPGSNGGL